MLISYESKITLVMLWNKNHIHRLLESWKTDSFGWCANFCMKADSLDSREFQLVFINTSRSWVDRKSSCIRNADDVIGRTDLVRSWVAEEICRKKFWALREKPKPDYIFKRISHRSKTEYLLVIHRVVGTLTTFLRDLEGVSMWLDRAEWVGLEARFETPGTHSFTG